MGVNGGLAGLLAYVVLLPDVVPVVFDVILYSYWFVFGTCFTCYFALEGVACGVGIDMVGEICGGFLVRYMFPSGFTTWWGLFVAGLEGSVLVSLLT